MHDGNIGTFCQKYIENIMPKDKGEKIFLLIKQGKIYT